MKSTLLFFKPEIDKKNLDVIFENKLETPKLTIETDLSKLNSIISNIIKNAIKYTSKGYIKIKLAKNESDILITINDSGEGIRKDKINKIFDRFDRGGLDEFKNKEGAGLGLSIVKSYVEMLGGRIEVESTFGVGSTFFVFIPMNNRKKQSQTNLLF